MTTRAGMFDDLERMDAHAWSSYLAPDSVARFGNADPVYGREACRDQLERFYRRIEALRHEVIEEWEHGDATIVEANLTCTRTDGSEVTLPVVTIFRTNGKDLISDYRVYVDAAPVRAEVYN